MSRSGGMFCPKDRRGCGKRLEWDDAAFCKKCMIKGLHQRLREMGVVISPLPELKKDNEQKRRDKEGRDYEI